MMLRDGDLIVLFLLLILVVFFIIRWWKKADFRPVLTASNHPIRGEVPTMLEADGFELIAAKQRLPIAVRVGDTSYDSRLYVDYVATRAGNTYLVVLAKDKKPLRFSGAILRDRFLAHVLAFRAAGILYVEPHHGMYKTVSFDVTGVRYPPRRRLASYVITLVIGALITLLIR
ncbi:hypothetical protein SAMN05444487_10472 [Marininema mesophilum]|uniref:Uncharacterized protein n=1 Tax=Marininema mesophilum TaxID=1048340 RepID=A0A1H2UD57_9BACL|nr:hypothetical protein [Marininema mesophilum]SDW54133.1 hypothetical protein SAMN05444487_10472 [Marininema mesophilum]